MDFSLIWQVLKGIVTMTNTYTQLCPQHARSLGYNLGPRTKGLCDICGSMNSFHVVRREQYHCIACDYTFTATDSGFHFIHCPLCNMHENVRKL